VVVQKYSGTSHVHTGGLITGPWTVSGVGPVRARRAAARTASMSGTVLAYAVSPPYRYDHRPSRHSPMWRSTFSPVRCPNAGWAGVPAAGVMSRGRLSVVPGR
jgi:hypothetical protein